MIEQEEAEDLLPDLDGPSDRVPAAMTNDSRFNHLS